MIEAQSIGNVEGLGEVFQVAAPLDKQIAAFRAKGIQYPYLVDPQDAVTIRLAGLSNDFTRTSLAPVATEGEKTVLYRPSPLMTIAMAMTAVNAHRNGRYPELSRDFYDIVKEIALSEEGIEPENKTAIVVAQQGDHPWTKEMPQSLFAFGKGTGEYFDRNKYAKIQYLDLQTNSKQSVVNYTWLYNPQGGSSLSCRDRGLNGDDRAFGVRAVGAESGGATSQNLGFGLTEIRDANSAVIPSVFKDKGVPALEGMLAAPLTNALLERLRTPEK
ncbi:MAG: hypothetical protein ABIH92_02135 [Nanoarchaeota archaeon]